MKMEMCLAAVAMVLQCAGKRCAAPTMDVVTKTDPTKANFEVVG